MLIAHKHILTSLEGINHYTERLRAALNYHHQSFNNKNKTELKYYISTIEAATQAIENTLEEQTKTSQNG